MVKKEQYILIVDDYKTMLRILHNLLEQMGFIHIEEATSGVMALAKMHDHDFTLIISEWNMEAMSGLELLKQVRSHERCHAIPFIMVTAESKQENMETAKEAGVNDYLVKPFNGEILKAKIDTVLYPK